MPHGLLRNFDDEVEAQELGIGSLVEYLNRTRTSAGLTPIAVTKAFEHKRTKRRIVIRYFENLGNQPYHISVHDIEHNVHLEGAYVESFDLALWHLLNRCRSYNTTVAWMSEYVNPED